MLCDCKIIVIVIVIVMDGMDARSPMMIYELASFEEISM